LGGVYGPAWLRRISAVPIVAKRRAKRMAPPLREPNILDIRWVRDGVIVLVCRLPAVFLFSTLSLLFFTSYKAYV
jgi:hypothetical protein